MLKIKYVAFLFCLVSTIVNAQPVQVEKKVVCDSVETIVNTLTKEYKEQVIWIGNIKDSQAALLVNPQTTTWTLLQFNRKIACVLETGESFKIMFESLDKKLKVID